MRFLLDIIGDGDRQIGDADACWGVAVHQQIVLAEAVFAGAVFAVAAVRAEADGRRDERPVEVIPTAQFGQKVARGVGTVVNFGVLDKMEAKKRCKPYVARL